MTACGFFAQSAVPSRREIRRGSLRFVADETAAGPERKTRLNSDRSNSSQQFDRFRCGGFAHSDSSPEEAPRIATYRRPPISLTADATVCSGYRSMSAGKDGLGGFHQSPRSWSIPLLGDRRKVSVRTHGYAAAPPPRSRAASRIQKAGLPRCAAHAGHIGGPGDWRRWPPPQAWCRCISFHSRRTRCWGPLWRRSRTAVRPRLNVRRHSAPGQDSNRARFLNLDRCPKQCAGRKPRRQSACGARWSMPTAR